MSSPIVLMTDPSRCNLGDVQHLVQALLEMQQMGQHAIPQAFCDHPESARDFLDAYASAYPQLVLEDRGIPTPDHLHALISTGQVGGIGPPNELSLFTDPQSPGESSAAKSLPIVMLTLGSSQALLDAIQQAPSIRESIRLIDVQDHMETSTASIADAVRALDEGRGTARGRAASAPSSTTSPARRRAISQAWRCMRTSEPRLVDVALGGRRNAPEAMQETETVATIVPPVRPVPIVTDERAEAAAPAAGPAATAPTEPAVEPASPPVAAVRPTEPEALAPETAPQEEESTSEEAPAEEGAGAGDGTGAEDGPGSKPGEGAQHGVGEKPDKEIDKEAGGKTDKADGKAEAAKDDKQAAATLSVDEEQGDETGADDAAGRIGRDAQEADDDVIYPPVGTLVASADVLYPAVDQGTPRCAARAGRRPAGRCHLRSRGDVRARRGGSGARACRRRRATSRRSARPVRTLTSRRSRTHTTTPATKTATTTWRTPGSRVSCTTPTCSRPRTRSGPSRQGTTTKAGGTAMSDRHEARPHDAFRSGTPFGDVLRRLRRTLAASVLFSFAVNLMILVSPLYMMQIYNRVLPSRSGSTLIMLTVLVVLALAALALLEAVRALVFVRIGGTVERDLNEVVIDSSFSSMLQQYSTTYDHALRDFDTIRQFMWSAMPANLLDMLWVPLFVLCVFLLHPLLGLIALGGALSLAAFGVLHNVLTRTKLQEAGQLSRGLSSVIERSLRHGQTLQAMGMLEPFKRRWIRERGRLITLQASAADRSGIFAGVTKSMRILLQTALLAFGAMLAINDEVSAGVIVAASMLMSRALAPVEATIGGWRQCLAAHGAFMRLNRLLASAPAPARRMRLPKPRGALQLEDVVVWPAGRGEPTLRGVSFALAPGEVLGVVGSSGSGKSTLARVAIGAWRPHAGKVRLDGAEIESYGRDELGPHLGYLPQEVELFEGTVAENISRFGELDAVSVVEAARHAGVHEMILGLPEGYETQLGPHGCVLSGGQRQRIGLARALYQSPVLVVLDEPNANLDSAGEEALINAVRTLKGLGSTVILISHRPKVLRDVDQLLMLRGGAPAFVRSRSELQREVSGARSAPLRWAEAR